MFFGALMALVLVRLNLNLTRIYQNGLWVLWQPWVIVSTDSIPPKKILQLTVFLFIPLPSCVAFTHAINFNCDLSKWDTSKVISLYASKCTERALFNYYFLVPEKCLNLTNTNILFCSFCFLLLLLFAVTIRFLCSVQ